MIISGIGWIELAVLGAALVLVLAPLRIFDTARAKRLAQACSEDEVPDHMNE